MPSPSVPPGVSETVDGPPAAQRHRVREFLQKPRVQLSLTITACVLLFAALIFPNVLSRLTPLGFLRLPLEGAAVLGLLVVQPPRARRVFAIDAGVLIGRLVI